MPSQIRVTLNSPLLPLFLTHYLPYCVFLLLNTLPSSESSRSTSQSLLAMFPAVDNRGIIEIWGKTFKSATLSRLSNSHVAKHIPNVRLGFSPLDYEAFRICRDDLTYIVK